MPKNKAKGSKIERELFQKFIDSKVYRVVRVAGSGMMENADCDLIAGRVGKMRKKYAIEVKSSKSPVKYISKDQIERFIIFSSIFELKPVIALRFNREGWLFIHPKELEDSGKNWKITLEKAKERGKKFSQYFG
ncbi:MAG: Holliday junction resolvase Hjc [Candidatus Pacearchaeota archaeon]